MTAFVTKGLNYVLRTGLGSTLVQEGYNKTGPRHFHMMRPDHTRVVGVVLDKFWGLDDKGRFTVKLGLFLPALAKAIGQPIPSGPPDLGHCYPLEEGLGALVPDALTEAGGRHEMVWSITRETDLDAFAGELCRAWQQFGREWMERCSTLRGARDWL